MLMGVMELSGPNEATTRKELIDPALKKVGWDVTNPEQVRTEIPVDCFDPNAWENVKRILEAGGIYEGNLPKGVSDYALYRPNSDIIAVVEAKRTSIDHVLLRPSPNFTSHN
jgi:type I restriction enzyme R subunit